MLPGERVQLVRHRDYEQQALSQAVKERVLPAPRGIVYDRSGNPLADNRKALHLVIQREDLPADPAVVKSLAEELFLLQTMGDDRAIAETYVAGKPMKSILQ